MKHVTVKTCAALAAALLLAACSGKTPHLPRLAPDAVILAFGDSLTSGSGAAADESYPAVLARLTGRRVINAGVPGEVSADGLKRLPALLDEHRPQLLILYHGGNDLLRRSNEQTLEQNLRAMAQLARARGVAVALVGVPKPSLLLSVPPLYERIASDLRLPYLGDALADIERDPRLKADPIHPNAEGYRLVAQRIHELLKRAGAV